MEEAETAASGMRRKVRRMVRRLLDNRVVWFRVARDPRSVMLTFDDGPHPEFTPQVLDLLDKHGARATFFLIGERAERHPDLVREIHGRGHCIGNHTWSHLNDCRGGTYSYGRYLGEIRRCQSTMRSIAGVETKLFRPPRGELNLKSLAATLCSRHRIVYWSLEGGEWGCRQHESGAAIAEFVVRTVQPRDIVLLHDDNEKTIAVLEALLPLAAERGFDLQDNALMRG